MKGIVRNIDQLGRVVIPKEIRQELEWTEGTPLDISRLDNGIFLQRQQVGCVICGSGRDVRRYRYHKGAAVPVPEETGVPVCARCVRLMAVDIADHADSAPEEPTGEYERYDGPEE